MRLIMAVIVTCATFLAGTVSVSAVETEKDIVNRYLKRTEKKRIHKLSWLSGSFSVNRTNRSNDYNRFATYTSTHFSNGSIPWLGDAKIFSLDMGIVFRERFAWAVGGEYWLKLGQTQSGSFAYSPAGGTPVTVSELTSEAQVLGISTQLQYYFLNHPSLASQLERLALRAGGGVGYYRVTWDVWSDYQNLNLSTSLSESTNITYKDSGPGFWFSLGADYPLKWHGFAVGAEMSYLYLNFDNVAWYNSGDQEVVATYDGTAEGRVDLDLSGVRGKVEIKRFFSW